VTRFLSQPQTLEQIQAGLDAVQKAGASGDRDQLNAVRRPNLSCDIPPQAAGNSLVFKLAIKNVVPEYQPYLAARSAAS
jgi:hypothetical protein